ncbi:hypothetical protein [Pseudomonas gingeri]
MTTADRALHGNLLTLHIAAGMGLILGDGTLDKRPDPFIRKRTERHALMCGDTKRFRNPTVSKVEANS